MSHGDWREEAKRAHTTRELERAVSHAPGWRIKHGKEHDLLCAPNGGKVAVPRHPGDLARGTLASIVKALLLLGGIVALVAWVW
jgi:predicted RNA binding protein YcfA (HicA-like mRNA interferase family)